MRRYLKDYLFLFSVGFGIILLDQLTKYLIQLNLAYQETWSPWPWLKPYARLVHWRNTGAVFGMFQDFGIVFAVLAPIVAVVIVYYFPQVPREDWPLRLALGMQFAGALGNFIDRLRVGYVIDFISVGTFAVFNVADSSISVGVALFLAYLWIKESKQKKAKAVALPLVAEEASPKKAKAVAPPIVAEEAAPTESVDE